MLKIKWQKEEDSRAGQVYILLNFEGGDADTRHPQEELIEGVTWDNYKENIELIEAEVNKYKLLQEILEDISRGRNEKGYEEILKEYGEEVASMYENVPGDPQADFQFKCYLDSIELVAYDNTGVKYTAYV